MDHKDSTISELQAQVWLIQWSESEWCW
jgi:hypothetical protein